LTATAGVIMAAILRPAEITHPRRHEVRAGEAGMMLDDLVSLQVFCSDVALLQTSNGAYRSYSLIDPRHPRARSRRPGTGGRGMSAFLGDLAVQIAEAIAALPPDPSEQTLSAGKTE
jgi:hypothetical protein